MLKQFGTKAFWSDLASVVIVEVISLIIYGIGNALVGHIQGKLRTPVNNAGGNNFQQNGFPQTGFAQPNNIAQQAMTYTPAIVQKPVINPLEQAFNGRVPQPVQSSQSVQVAQVAQPIKVVQPQPQPQQPTFPGFS